MIESPCFSSATIGKFKRVSAILFRSLSSLELHWAIAHATLERLSSAHAADVELTQKIMGFFQVYVDLQEGNLEKHMGTQSV